MDPENFSKMVRKKEILSNRLKIITQKMRILQRIVKSRDRTVSKVALKAKLQSIKRH
jgi:hypothetical protein